MKDFKSALTLAFITFIFLFGGGALYQLFSTKEAQQLLFNHIIKILAVGHLLVISLVFVYEYIRNRDLPKEERQYKLTTITIGMLFINLLTIYIISTFL